jgi:hypothetical protein
VTDFEKQGYWWLPEAPDKQIAGTIVYGHTTKSELRLLGSLQDEMKSLQQMGRWGDVYSPEIILGLTADGKKITLYDCTQSGAHLSFSSFMTETYSPSIVLEGRHFAKADEMVFHEMTMRLSHLGGWYQRTGRHVEFESADSDRPKMTLRYQRSDLLSVPYDDGHIELGLDGNIQFARFSGDFVVSEKACVSVCPKSPARMVEFLEVYLPPVTHFFEMGVGRCLALLELRGTASADCPDGTDEQVKHAPTIQLYWEKKRHGDEDKELFPHDMICTCSDMQSDLERHFGQWMRAYREIKPVMQLFFGKVIGRESFSSNSFLNSVQAAEAYHRYRRGGTDLPENEHQERVERILNASPENYRDWLGTKLQHSNEVGLRRRLRELLIERADLFEFTPSEIKHHAHRITDIRNHFTHYSGEQEPAFATGRDFYVYDSLMFWTVVACLLEEMGIERQKAHRLVLRNQSFLHFKIVYLKNQQAEIMKVESVRPEDVPVARADDKEKMR